MIGEPPPVDSDEPDPAPPVVGVPPLVNKEDAVKKMITCSVLTQSDCMQGSLTVWGLLQKPCRNGFALSRSSMHIKMNHYNARHNDDRRVNDCNNYDSRIHDNDYKIKSVAATTVTTLKYDASESAPSVHSSIVIPYHPCSTRSMMKYRTSML